MSERMENILICLLFVFLVLCIWSIRDLAKSMVALTNELAPMVSLIEVEQEVVTGEVSISGPATMEWGEPITVGGLDTSDRYWEGYWDGYVEGTEAGADHVMFGVVAQRIGGEPKTFGAMVEEAVAGAEAAREEFKKLDKELNAWRDEE